VLDWIASEETGKVEIVVIVKVALSSNEKVEFEDWMRKVELDVLEVRLVLSVLVLGDDSVHWRDGELITFLGINEDASDEERCVDIVLGDFGSGGGGEDLDVWSRNLDESLEVLDAENNVHVRVQESSGGHGLSWSSGVEEWEWHIVVLRFLGGKNTLFESVVFTDHLEETLTWLSSEFFGHVEVVTGDDIDGLLVEENGSGFGESLSSGIDPSSPEWSARNIVRAVLSSVLVRALVNLSKVGIDTRLNGLGIGLCARIGKRLEIGLVFARASLFAFL